MKTGELFPYFGAWFIDGKWVQQVVYYNIPWSVYRETNWRFKEVEGKRTRLVPYCIITKAKVIIHNMNEVERSKVYGHYVCKMLALKHDFAMFEYIFNSDNRVIKSNSLENFIWHNSRIVLHKLWKNTQILSYKEFVSTDKIVEWYWKFFL